MWGTLFNQILSAEEKDEEKMLVRERVNS